MMLQIVPSRAYSDEELDAAVASISAPGRLSEAQEVVMRTAPSLQRLLAVALAEGGWFDAGHAQAVREAAGTEDPSEREREVQTLVAEEARLGMMVGVAVGFQLARELDGSGSNTSSSATADDPSTPAAAGSTGSTAAADRGPAGSAGPDRGPAGSAGPDRGPAGPNRDPAGPNEINDQEE
jgi:hypothetical protein